MFDITNDLRKSNSRRKEREKITRMMGQVYKSKSEYHAVGPTLLITGPHISPRCPFNV